MHLFYSPDISESELKVGQKHQLSPEEASHAIRVLRLKNDDEVVITDGKGHWIQSRILSTTKRDCTIEFSKIEANYGKRDFHLHLAVGPTKNIKRFDWFLEKATEMGIDEITPLISFHSERRDVNIQRSNKVITAAMKQSLKAYHPKLNEALALNEFFQNNQESQKYIAHYTGPEQLLLKDIDSPANDIVILIGPEGDFSNQEVNDAVSLGFIPVSLGNTRLRTETAALAATFTINLLNQK